MRTILKLWLIYSIFDERYDCQPGLATCQKCVTDRICGFIKRDLVEKVVGYISLDNPVATLNGIMPKNCGAEIHYSKKHQGFLFEVSLNYKITMINQKIERFLTETAIWKFQLDMNMGRNLLGLFEEKSFYFNLNFIDSLYFSNTKASHHHFDSASLTS